MRTTALCPFVSSGYLSDIYCEENCALYVSGDCAIKLLATTLRDKFIVTAAVNTDTPIQD